MSCLRIEGMEAELAVCSNPGENEYPEHSADLQRLQAHNFWIQWSENLRENYWNYFKLGIYGYHGYRYTGQWWVVIVIGLSFLVDILGFLFFRCQQLSTRISRGNTSIKLHYCFTFFISYNLFLNLWLWCTLTNKSKNKFTFTVSNILIFYFMSLLCHFCQQRSNQVNMSGSGPNPNPNPAGPTTKAHQCHQ